MNVGRSQSPGSTAHAQACTHASEQKAYEGSGAGKLIVKDRMEAKMEIAASIVSATTRPDAGALGSCEQRKFAPASIWTAAMLAALEIGVTGRKWHSLIDKVYRLETLELGWVHTPIPSPSPRSTALSAVAYGRSCADRITVRGRAVACAITPTGQTRSSLILGCSRWSQLITWRANPDAETADWRARRGRTAHRVRREGTTARSFPTPIEQRGGARRFSLGAKRACAQRASPRTL